MALNQLLIYFLSCKIKIKQFRLKLLFLQLALRVGGGGHCRSTLYFISMHQLPRPLSMLIKSNKKANGGRAEQDEIILGNKNYN